MIRFAVLALVLALAPSVVHADDAKNDPYADSGPAAEFASTRLALAPADGSDLIVLLQSIRFTTASAEIATISQLVLLDVAAVIQEHNEWTTIDIGGHTDSVGAADKNHELSQGRAEAVLETLVKGGVDRERLTATGFGETKPIAWATDELGHAKNRRVEFRVSTAPNAEWVRDQMRPRLAAVENCFATRLAAVPSLSARFDLAWTVATDGTARDVRVLSTDADDPTFGECIRDVINETRFDQVSEEVTVDRYPVIFPRTAVEAAPPDDAPPE